MVFGVIVITRLPCARINTRTKPYSDDHAFAIVVARLPCVRMSNRAFTKDWFPSRPATNAPTIRSEIEPSIASQSADPMIFDCSLIHDGEACRSLN